MSSSIPRFLLPQRGSIWSLRSLPSNQVVRTARYASSKPKPSPKVQPPRRAANNQTTDGAGKPITLEQPTKFTPPSHPQRLNKTPRQYPGPQLSAEEKARQATKRYPNSMPPEGTVMYRFLTSHGLHTFISMGVLIFVALWSYTLSLRASPFGELLPELSSVFSHPILFFRAFAEVVRLETARHTEETRAKRDRTTEDISKRAAYRKAHGLEKEGLGGWTANTDGVDLGEAAVDPQDPKAQLSLAGVTVTATDEEPPLIQKKKPKMWLGIW